MQVPWRQRFLSHRMCIARQSHVCNLCFQFRDLLARSLKLAIFLSELNLQLLDLFVVTLGTLGEGTKVDGNTLANELLY